MYIAANVHYQLRADRILFLTVVGFATAILLAQIFLYVFAKRIAREERQIWPSRTRSHCRAQIEFVMFAGN